MVKEKLKKFLILGNYGNSNVGDEALLKEVSFQIVEKYGNKGIELFVPTRNPGFVNIYHKDIKKILKPFYLFNLVGTIKASLFSKDIIVGGGGIWSGYTGPAAKILPIYLIVLEALGKKIYVKGVGLYKTASKLERFFVNLSFLFAKEIQVRDEESFQNLWKINRKRAKSVPDLAISLFERVKMLDKNYSKELESLKEYSKIKQKAGKGKVIGISIKPTKNIKQNTKIIQEISMYINSFDSLKKRPFFVFMPFAKTNSLIENDLKMTKEVIKKLNRKDNVLILTHTNPIIWYLIIKRKIDLFIGMRLHSVIFASKAGKKFIALPYENKVLEFLKSTKNKRVVNLDVLSSENLYKITKELES